MRAGTTRSVPIPPLLEGVGEVRIDNNASKPASERYARVSASNGINLDAEGRSKSGVRNNATAACGASGASGLSDPCESNLNDSCRFLDSPANDTMDTAVSSTNEDPLVELLDDDDGDSFASSHGRMYPSIVASAALEEEMDKFMDQQALLRNTDSPYTTSSVLTESTAGSEAGPVLLKGAPKPSVATANAIRDQSAPPASANNLEGQVIASMDIIHHDKNNNSLGSLLKSDHASEASHLENTEVEHDEDEDEDDDDDDDDDDDAGVIAIGLPALMIHPPKSPPPSARKNVEEDEDSKMPPPEPKTVDEANQRLVSEVVAQNLAEEEHNQKRGVKDRLANLVETGAVQVVPRSPVAAAARRRIGAAAAATTAPPATSSGASDDEMTRVKNQERERMSRAVMAAASLSLQSSPTASNANAPPAAVHKNPENVEDRDAAIKRAIQREMMQGRISSTGNTPVRLMAAAAVSVEPTASVEDKDAALKNAIKNELRGHVLARATSAATTSTTAAAPTQEDKDTTLKRAIQREMQGQVGTKVPGGATTRAPTASTTTQEDKDTALKNAIKNELQGTTARPVKLAAESKKEEDKDVALKKAIQREMQGRSASSPEATNAHALDRIRREQAKIQGSVVGSNDVEGPMIASASTEEGLATNSASTAAWVKDAKKPAASATAAPTSEEAAAAYATARFRQELVKMINEDAEEVGPSLAPALAADEAAVPSPSLPGAYHGTIGQDTPKSQDDGPRLAPAVDSSESEPAANSPAPVAATASGSMIRSSSVSSDLEAQMGIPVLPGAFAVDGISPSRRRRRSSTMDSGNHGSAYDSYDDEDGEYEDDDYDDGDDFDDEHTIDSHRRRNRQSFDAELGMDAAFIHGVDASSYPVDAALVDAFEAELHVVVEGAVINPEDDLQIDPKAVKKLRIMQGCILCFSLAAIGIIVGIIMGFKNGQVDEPVGWTQVGADLIGPKEEPQTLFGQSVAVTSDGSRVAAAAPGLDVELELNVGEILIMDAAKMKNGSNEWVVNETLVGEDPTFTAKSSLAMSLDGTILVSGLPYLGTFGAVATVQESSGSWETLGASNLEPSFDFNGTTDESIWFGYSVAVTSDGTVLAVGAPMMTALVGGTSVKRAGGVYCYRLVQGQWDEIAVLRGKEANEMLGWSVSIQKTEGSGYRLAAGGASHDAERGLVRVYDSATGDDWAVAATFEGGAQLLRFGESLALSSSGATVLAVGARGNALDKGQVHVYRLDDKGAWVEDKQALEGQEHAEGYGASVALSEDGNVLAVGAPQSSAGGLDAGRVEAYKYDGVQGLWVLEGKSILGSTGEEFGSAVALANQGMRIVAGAPSTTFDGSIVQAGAVRVYDRDA